MPVGRCANCDAPVSYFARACAHCGLPNQPNAVTLVAALGLLVVIGAAAFFGARALLAERTATPNPAAQNPAQTTTVESKPDDFGWLVQAMAECDVYAKQYADTLYFLIIPLTPTGRRVQAWDPSPIGKIGTSADLVSSDDAVFGLRNGVFQIYRESITFAVKDAATQTVFKWKPTNGVSELKSRERGFASLMIGLQVGDKEPDWGPSVTLVSGQCYWVMPVIPTPGSAAPAPAQQ